MNHNYLSHYGIKGMKWGVRRYQSKDGSLTSAGKNRYGAAANRYEKAAAKYGAKADAYKGRIGEIEYRDKQKKYAAKAKANKIAAKTWDDASSSVAKVKSDWSAAKQKAKTDPSYKNSNEYKTAKKKNTSRLVEKAIYGKEGQTKIAALKNAGYTDFGSRFVTALTGQRLTTGQLSLGMRYSDLVRKYGQ